MRLGSILFFLILAFLVTFLFGVWVIVFLPIPGVFLILKDNRWIWGLGAMAVIIANLLILGFSQYHVLILFLIFIIITILFYIGIKRKWGPQKIILDITIIGLFIMLIGIAFHWLGSGYMSVNVLLENEKTLIYNSVEQYKKNLEEKKWLDKTGEQAKWITEHKDLIVQTIINIMPAFFVSLIFFSAFMNFFIIESLLSNSNLPSDAAYVYYSINEWQVNDLFPWVVIIGLGLILIKLTPVRILAWNILIIMAILYLTQGIAVFFFIMDRMNIGFMGKFIILFLGFIFFYFYPILVVLGFSDTWIDFRKLRVKAA